MPSLKSAQTIRFHHLERASFRNKSLIKDWVTRILKDAKLSAAAINYIFCSDEYLRNINKEYLDHDYYTDIITFDLSEPGAPVTADIYISIDRVKDNARQFGKTFEQELVRVIFHGALHLSGYKDKSGKDAKIMREREDYYLGRFLKAISK